MGRGAAGPGDMNAAGHLPGRHQRSRARQAHARQHRVRGYSSARRRNRPQRWQRCMLFKQRGRPKVPVGAAGRGDMSAAGLPLREADRPPRKESPHCPARQGGVQAEKQTRPARPPSEQTGRPLEQRLHCQRAPGPTQAKTTGHHPGDSAYNGHRDGRSHDQPARPHRSTARIASVEGEPDALPAD
jgi:hypothetical protein